MSGVRLGSLAMLIVIAAACSSTQSVATPSSAVASALPSAAASDPASAPASPSAVASADPAEPTLEDLAGTWRLEAGNARVVSATGPMAGGSVAIEGDKIVFSAGDYRSRQPLEFPAQVDLDCNASRCIVGGMQLLWITKVGGELVVVNAATLTPVGDFDDRCGWTDVPDAGVVQAQETGLVGGRQVPTVLRFATGVAGGVGTGCSGGGYAVAYDVTATRVQ